ncbi:MAG: hypothetical protein F4X98_14580 [Gammaproteobacteria bacterium]|nr:hypothetical protein [Gammaproteobacteria bacterium]
MRMSVYADSVNGDGRWSAEPHVLPEHVEVVRMLAESEERARRSEAERRAAERRIEELETILRRSRPDG